MSKKESEFIHDDPIKSEENATEKEKNEEVSGSPSSSPFSSPDKKRSKREVSDPITIEKPNSSDPQQQATTSKVIPLWVAGEKWGKSLKTQIFRCFPREICVL